MTDKGPLIKASVGQVGLLAYGVKEGAGYYSFETMYDTYKKYGLAKTGKNDAVKILKKGSKAPIATSAPFIGSVIYKKRVAPKLRKKFGSWNVLGLDILRLSP